MSVSHECVSKWWVKRRYQARGMIGHWPMWSHVTFWGKCRRVFVFYRGHALCQGPYYITVGSLDHGPIAGKQSNNPFYRRIILFSEEDL